MTSQGTVDVTPEFGDCRSSSGILPASAAKCLLFSNVVYQTR